MRGRGKGTANRLGYTLLHRKTRYTWLDQSSVAVGDTPVQRFSRIFHQTETINGLIAAPCASTVVLQLLARPEFAFWEAF